MTGGGGGVIIIQNLVNSGQFTENDSQQLLDIADRSVVRCSFLDAWKVCRIVWRRLRKAG